MLYAPVVVPQVRHRPLRSCCFFVTLDAEHGFFDVSNRVIDANGMYFVAIVLQVAATASLKPRRLEGAAMDLDSGPVHAFMAD